MSSVPIEEPNARTGYLICSPNRNRRCIGDGGRALPAFFGRRIRLAMGLLTEQFVEMLALF